MSTQNSQFDKFPIIDNANNNSVMDFNDAVAKFNKLCLQSDVDTATSSTHSADTNYDTNELDDISDWFKCKDTNLPSSVGKVINNGYKPVKTEPAVLPEPNALPELAPQNLMEPLSEFIPDSVNDTVTETLAPVDTDVPTTECDEFMYLNLNGPEEPEVQEYKEPRESLSIQESDYEDTTDSDYYDNGVQPQAVERQPQHSQRNHQDHHHEQQQEQQEQQEQPMLSSNDEAIDTNLFLGPINTDLFSELPELDSINEPFSMPNCNTPAIGNDLTTTTTCNSALDYDLGPLSSEAWEAAESIASSSTQFNSASEPNLDMSIPSEPQYYGANKYVPKTIPTRTPRFRASSIASPRVARSPSGKSRMPEQISLKDKYTVNGGVSKHQVCAVYPGMKHITKRTAPFDPFERIPFYNSVNKMSLKCLYDIMGLSHDPETAKERERYIFYILEQEGFDPCLTTWVRDTSEFRRDYLLRRVAEETAPYGYSKEILELIIKRGSYARMQVTLRNLRREQRIANASKYYAY